MPTAKEFCYMYFGSHQTHTAQKQPLRTASSPSLPRPPSLPTSGPKEKQTLPLQCLLQTGLGTPRAQDYLLGQFSQLSGHLQGTASAGLAAKQLSTLGEQRRRFLECLEYHDLFILYPAGNRSHPPHKQNSDQVPPRPRLPSREQ